MSDYNDVFLVNLFLFFIIFYYNNFIFLIVSTIIKNTKFYNRGYLTNPTDYAYQYDGAYIHLLTIYNISYFLMSNHIDFIKFFIPIKITCMQPLP